MREYLARCGQRALVGIVDLSPLVQQSAAVEDEPRREDLGARRAGLDHRALEQLRDARARLARPHEQDALRLDRLLRDAQRGQNRGDGNGRGALDVVIKRAVVVAVFVENPGGVAGRKILPVQ